jgi:hypothetical protein
VIGATIRSNRAPVVLPAYNNVRPAHSLLKEYLSGFDVFNGMHLDMRKRFLNMLLECGDEGFTVAPNVKIVVHGIWIIPLELKVHWGFCRRQ